ncbi:MAG TPA: hypothetical protein VJL28_00400 [Gemmatimonadaceae bacterium]|nr:hypothetical protein [Gemmatimonadaceae bacterium]
MNAHANPSVLRAAPHTLASRVPWGLSLAALAALACGPVPRSARDIRLWTTDFEIRVSTDVLPPRALEQSRYTVVVRDRKTREPIADGQGRIFATNADGKTIWDGFTYGPEVGTYHARLMFLTAGEWAMNVQFRRDSTSALQRPEYDWRQEIRVGAEPGDTSRPG